MKKIIQKLITCLIIITAGSIVFLNNQANAKINQNDLSEEVPEHYIIEGKNETENANSISVVAAPGVKIRLGGRVQVQMATSPCTSFPPPPGSPCMKQVPAVDFFMRRVRFSLEIEVSELITGKINPDFPT